MTLSEGVFYFFSAMALVSGTMVIVAKNPVRAVLSLIVTFIAMSSLWLLLEAEFLAIALVLVYVGAVMVLFLFVVMMLDIGESSRREGFAKFLPLGICVSVLVVLGLVTAVGHEDFGAQKYPIPVPHEASFSNINALGELLYTEYLYPFEIAGILLLVAIVAAISLTFKGRRLLTHSVMDEPVQASKKNRLRIVKMESETGNSIC
jgi:NADH-quinone oxidoreductase subunit J